MVLEKILEGHLDRKEIKPVNPEGNQPGILIGRTDVEAEAPVLWPPDVKSLLHGHRNLVGYSPRGNKESYLDVICFWPFLMLLQQTEVLNFDVKFISLFLCCLLKYSLFP